MFDVFHPLELCTTLNESHGSSTYQVVDTSVGEQRVLKVLQPRSAPSKAICPCITDLSTYLHLQCPALAQYKRAFKHSQTGAIHLVRELFKEPLGCLIKKYRESYLAISEHTVLKILKQVLEGLQYLHAPPQHTTEPVVHGRLHLNNVMLRQDGSVAICDASYLFPNSIPYSSSAYEYMQSFDRFTAPEASTKGAWTRKSDIWSFGVLAYMMCTMEDPGSLSTDRFLQSVFENPLMMRYSPQLRAVISSALSVNPGLRPEAGDLLRGPLFAHIKDSKISFINEEMHTAETDIQVYATTDLMIAASRGDYGAAIAHIDQCGRTTALGKTALMYAAQNGHAHLIPLLKDEVRLQIINPESPAYGRTALMYAAVQNHCDVITHLLPLEAGIQNGKGKTALMMAAEKGHVEAVKLLAPHEKGLRSNLGMTALMIAVTYKKNTVARLLAPMEKRLKTAQGRTALMIAAKYNMAEALEFLLPHEGGIKRKTGTTALMVAAAQGSADFVRVMVDMFLRDSSNPHLELGMRDKKGRSALMHAVQSAQASCVELLIGLERDILDNKQHDIAYYAKRMKKRMKKSPHKTACISLLTSHGILESPTSGSLHEHKLNNSGNEHSSNEMESSISMREESNADTPPQQSALAPFDELLDFMIVESDLEKEASTHDAL